MGKNSSEKNLVSSLLPKSHLNLHKEMFIWPKGEKTAELTVQEFWTRTHRYAACLQNMGIGIKTNTPFTYYILKYRDECLTSVKHTLPRILVLAA